MRTSTTLFLSLLVFLMGGCSSMPVGPTGDKADGEPEGASLFTTRAVACLGDGDDDAKNWLQASACLYEENTGLATLERFEENLRDLDGLRQLAIEEGFTYLGPDVQPTDADDILDAAIAEGKSACASLVDSGEGRMRCELVVQAAVAYQIATVVYEDYDTVRPLLPKSPREDMQGCTDTYDDTMENANSTHEMLQASFDWNDCVRAINMNTVYEDTVGADACPDGDADCIASAQNQWQLIRLALDGVTDESARLCELMVAMSDSPEGSISQLYRSSCSQDIETFVAIAIDTVRAAPRAAPETIGAD